MIRLDDGRVGNGRPEPGPSPTKARPPQPSPMNSTLQPQVQSNNRAPSKGSEGGDDGPTIDDKIKQSSDLFETVVSSEKQVVSLLEDVSSYLKEYPRIAIDDLAYQPIYQMEQVVEWRKKALGISMQGDQVKEDKLKAEFAGDTSLKHLNISRI